MTSERRAAFARSAHRRPAYAASAQRPPIVRPPKPIPPDVMFVLLLVDGALIGIVLSALLAVGLYGFGWLSFGVGLPGQALEEVYPPPPVFFPVCPTCSVSCTATSPAEPTPTPTHTPTPTPDFPATATQACSDWRWRFPATPCPAFVTPSP
jgi:hypothetical protein